MKMVALLVMATWVYAGAAIGEVAGPPGLSLPGEIAGWKWDGAERQYDSRSVFDYIDGAGEMFSPTDSRTSRFGDTRKPTSPP